MDMRRFKRCRSAAFRIVENEAVIVLPESDRIFVLNSTGSIIWTMLDGSRSLDEISTHISEDCRVDKETAAKDVTKIVSLLKSHSLLEELDRVQEPTNDNPTVPVCVKYEPPAILAEEEIAVVAGLCTSGHSGDPLCRTSGPGCTTLFSP